MFDHILITVDGSDSATNAAAHGLRLASRFDARVDVVHVLDAPTHTRRGGEPDPHSRGREVIETVTQQASDYGVSVDTYLLEGASASAIVDHITDRGVDLVAMGRHGRSGAGERLLGTVTERVLRGVETPVLTVGETETTTGYEAVLVPTDGSDAAERALPSGEAIASGYGAALHCLSVADIQAAAGIFDAGGVSQEFVDRVIEESQTAIDRLVGAVTADVTVTESVVRGIPHEGIGEYVGDNDIDIVVMGSTGASSLTGQALGSVANRVVRTVSVPVLVV